MTDGLTSSAIIMPMVVRERIVDDYDIQVSFDCVKPGDQRMISHHFYLDVEIPMLSSSSSTYAVVINPDQVVKYSYVGPIQIGEEVYTREEITPDEFSEQLGILDYFQGIKRRELEWTRF